ncbi:MAG TPA: transposase domain-containing protein [Polyangiaceae bacterium]|nr:transposase domain-containing protein [Polyangiaceae bacterium]
MNTVFVSLLASARLHDIEPLAYLRDLLCLLPSWPRQRLLELAPAYGKQTFEQPETQQKLGIRFTEPCSVGAGFASLYRG